MRQSLPSRGAWIETAAAPIPNRRLSGRSLPSRGAWIETCRWSACICRACSESLPSRGAWIETVPVVWSASPSASLPSRGAWIETAGGLGTVCKGVSRSPHGGRGLKHRPIHESIAYPQGRSPHGGRGLKLRAGRGPGRGVASLPSRGAWIETTHHPGCWPGMYCRSPHGGRGLKLPISLAISEMDRRSPHGGRGLKLFHLRGQVGQLFVAPLTGGVD